MRVSRGLIDRSFLLLSACADWQIMQPAAPQQPEAEEPAVFRPFTMEEGPASPDRQAGVASGNEFGEASQLDERLGYGSDETGQHTMYKFETMLK